MKKNFALWVGIGVPVLMILFVAASIYIPRLSTDPQYSFIYSSGDYYYGKYVYTVDNGGRLTRTEVQSNPDIYPKIDPRVDQKIYFYDMKTDTSREISFEEAQKLVLDPNIQSPDGFEVVNGTSSGFMPLFYSGDNYNSIYIKGHGFSKKINTMGNRGYYDFKLIGWVK